MAYHGYSDGMIVTDSDLPYLGDNFSIESIGEVDSDGNTIYYGDHQEHQRRRPRQVCKKHRQQPRHYFSPSSAPRSRARYEDDTEYADMVQDVGGIDLDDSRTRTAYSRPSPHGSSRTQQYNESESEDERYAPAPPSRSQIGTGPPPSRQTQHLAPRRYAEPEDDNEYDEPFRGHTARGGGGYGGDERSIAEIRADLAPLDADQAEYRRGGGSSGSDRLYKVAGSGAKGRPRVKGERTANAMLKFLSHW